MAADWTKFDERARVAIALYGVWQDLHDKACAEHGGSVLRHQLIAGGIFEHWPVDTKAMIRVAMHNFYVAKDAAIENRPKRTQLRTAIRRYNKLAGNL